MGTYVPPSIAILPVDRAGRPIPWFVDEVNGKPDPRIANAAKWRAAVRYNLCWVCGEKIAEKVKAFVIGPMCAVNRITAEPPCHRECAIYSAQHCPFLTTPTMVRRERHLPKDRIDPAGEMILRNPGVTVVWRTRSYTLKAAPGGQLFDLGEPAGLPLWFACGRQATRAEILASIDSGMPLLRDAVDSPEATEDLDRRLAVALALVPA